MQGIVLFADTVSDNTLSSEEDYSQPMVKENGVSQYADIQNNAFLGVTDEPDLSAEKIYTAEDLFNIQNNLMGSYVLMNDIDLSGKSFEVIGKTKEKPFKGKLDGQGHKITGLSVNVNIDSASLNSPSHAVGLFGVCDGATVKNVEFEDVSISIISSSGYTYTSSINGTNVYAGVVAGYMINNSVVYNCIISGRVNAKTTDEAFEAYAGGVAGYVNSSVVSYVQNSSSTEAYTENTVSSAPSYSGGIAGFFNGEGYIDHSYNSGSIVSSTKDYGNSFSGGLIGKSDIDEKSVMVKDCYNTGSVTANAGNMFSDNAYAGGIAGSFTGNIDCVYNCGIVNALVTSYMGGKAYAGGICGSGNEQAAIINSANLQTNINASAIDGVAKSCIANENCTKKNNITIEASTNGVTNDADYVKTLHTMMLTASYKDILSWDFNTTWEIDEGAAFPKLMKVDKESEIYQSDYINQHLKYIEGNAYQDMLKNQRWAQIYWSEENNFYSNMGGALYTVIDGSLKVLSLNFSDLFEDGNPYRVILADYIGNSDVEKNVIELYKVEVPLSIDKIYKKGKKFVEKNWKSEWGELSDEDIFYLFHYAERDSSEWVNSDFPKHIEQIIWDTKNSGEGFETVLGITTECLDEILASKKFLDEGIDCINSFVDYVAHVNAYLSANAEFREVLVRMGNNLPDANPVHRQMLKEAIESYTKYNDENDITVELMAEFIKGTTGKTFLHAINKKLSGGVEGWLKKVMSAEAFLKYKAIVAAANAGWTISEYITKNGDLQDCRNMLRSNAYFETSMFSTLNEIEKEFQADPTLENAKLFDAAFKFFKEVQIYSVDTTISYLDTYQTAFLPALLNWSHSFLESAIDEAMYTKLYFYNSYCHGEDYNLGGKIVTVACPTDIYLYDMEGNELLTIIDGEITKNTNEIDAFVQNGVKKIILPNKQDYNLKISASDNGVMDYYISEYNETMQKIQTVVYEKLPLVTGESYQGIFSSDASSLDKSNLFNYESELIKPSIIISDNNYTPVEKIVIKEKVDQIHVGSECLPSVEVFPFDASAKTVVWSSENPLIASVSENGSIIGVSPGRTTIVAKSLCDNKKDIMEVVVKDHLFSAYLSNKDASCECEGTKTAVCEVCGAKHTIKDIGSVLKHDFSDYISDNNATTEKDGTKSAICKRCGKKDTKIDEGSKIIIEKDKSVLISKLTLISPSKKLAAGKKVEMFVNVIPSNATNQAVTWKTSNKKYATIDKNGKLTLKKAGAGKKVTITALAKDESNKEASIKIKIMKHAVKSIRLKAPAKTLKAGKSMKIKAIVKTTGKNANKVLKWSSSNLKYATVSKTGKVTAKKAGKGKKIMITASSTDGSNKKARIKLKIK